jgi:hypothetical protein
MADEEGTAAQDTGTGAGAPGAPATRAATDTTVGVGTAFLAAAQPADAEPERLEHEEPWEAPRADDRGFAIDPAGLPINARLRSLALAKAGETEDEGGLVSPEQIASAAERIDAYSAAYPPLDGMKTADLEARAKAEGVDISAAKTNEDRAALIAAARPELV